MGVLNCDDLINTGHRPKCNSKTKNCPERNEEIFRIVNFENITITERTTMWFYEGESNMKTMRNSSRNKNQ